MARPYVSVKKPEPSLRLVEEAKNISHTMHGTAIESIHTTTKLNFAFFSKPNMDIIQNAIRYNVWARTNQKHLIARQSDTELGIVMRSFYLQYGKNLDTNVAQQVQELNNLVVEYIVPQLISQIQQYEGYLRDISKPYTIMDRPTHTAVHGEKSFNLARFI
jgi:hypothetical protein